MKSKKIKIIIESESHADKLIELNEEEAIDEAMSKNCMVAFY